jgi:hypothetical protein
MLHAILQHILYFINLAFVDWVRIPVDAFGVVQ